MSKHSNSDNSSCEDLSPHKKKRRCEIEFEPIRICSIGSVRELNDKALRAQHYKLSERYKFNEKVRNSLEKRIEEHERKQLQDDAILCIINRYWNRLDENLQILLQRFELMENGLLEDIKSGESKFLLILSQWSCEETEKRMNERVEFSHRVLQRLLAVFETLVKKNEFICSLLSNVGIDNDGDSSLDEETTIKPRCSINKEIKKHAEDTLKSNRQLQSIVNNLQTENNQLKLQLGSRDDHMGILESRLTNLNNELEDSRYELQKSMLKEEKLQYRLREYIHREKQASLLANEHKISATNGIDDAILDDAKKPFEELQQQLDDQTALANNRLTEIEELVERNKTLSSELEKSKLKINHVPDEYTKMSSEYRTLQSHYSSLLDDSKFMNNEIAQLKLNLDDERKANEELVKSMRIDAATELKQMQNMLGELENNLNLVKKDYDVISTECEQLKADRDQFRPIHDQVKIQLNSYKNHNTQLRKEVTRFKNKSQFYSEEITSCKKELEAFRKLTSTDSSIIVRFDDKVDKCIPNESPTEQSELMNNSLGNSGNNSLTNSPMEERNSLKCDDSVGHFTALGEGTSALKPDLLSSPSSSDQQLKQLTLERDKLKEKLCKLGKLEAKERKKLVAEEMRRKMRQLEEQCEKMKRELANARQEEDGLMAEMDQTGSALEDMQEQNQKLLQELQEKEGINLKLMSERMNANQLFKKLKDEREEGEQLIKALRNQLDAKHLLCQRLEEHEREWKQCCTQYDHEIRLREQANDSMKRKELEANQALLDLKIRMERLTNQLTEIQESMAKKAALNEESTMKINRLQEGNNNLKKELRRAKKMEKFENADELLIEENKQLKETLKCPTCKSNNKNAILTKCYHVFCYDCLKLRYDNRRRKCPKCNAAFGANDYKRVYIE